jgi:peptidoglycan/xylan/chitin deacetylase (PgdA/CDA1 family)
MRLDRHITSLLAARGERGKPECAIPILMYHGVHAQCDVARPPYYRTVTSPARFEMQMKLLLERGYRTLRLGEMLSRIGAREADVPGPGHGLGLGKAVVITFDDALESFATQAYPILERYGYAATVFVPSAYIGRPFVTGENCMSRGQLRELTRAGVEFGSHTANHPKLYEADVTTIRRELRQSRQEVSDVTGLDVDLFSYPFAFPSHDRTFVRLLEQELQAAGYRAGTTTSIGRASKRSPRYFLPRLPVNDCDDDRLFMGKLDGHYDWLATAQGAFRHAKHWKAWLGERGQRQ